MSTNYEIWLRNLEKLPKGPVGTNRVYGLPVKKSSGKPHKIRVKTQRTISKEKNDESKIEKDFVVDTSIQDIYL